MNDKKRCCIGITFVTLFLFLSSCQQENASELEFFLSVPDSIQQTDEKIFVASNLNGWNPQDSSFMLKQRGENLYVLSYSLKELPESVSFPLTVEYKYTKGSWDRVEKNFSGEDVPNRLILLKDRATSMMLKDTVISWGKPRASTAAGNVTVLEENFFMPTLQRYRKIWIYLPLDYAQHPQKRYPVLYMQDGQNLFDDLIAPYGEWQIDETLNALKAELIVVGIEHGAEKRLDEYSPYRNEKYGGGEGDEYLAFIVNHLKPYIDKNFRTLTEPKHTWIGGSSMGGLISFYGVLKYSDTFHKALVFSPSFWFSDSLYRFVENANLKKFPVFYLLAGGQEGYDVAKDIQRMENLLQKNRNFSDQNYRYKFVETGKHQESFWASEFSEAFQWLLTVQ